MKNDFSEEEIKKFREEFQKRRSARLTIFFILILLMIGITLIAFPSWELLGMPKLAWAPFFYLIVFGLILVIAFIWRCPVCNGRLGDVFNTKFCSKCGFQFTEKEQ